MLHQSDLMSSLLFNSLVKILIMRFLRRMLQCLRSMMLMSLPFIRGNWLSSLLSKRSVSWIMHISNCLCILRESVSGREDGLRNVLLIIVNSFVVLFSIEPVISVIADHSVVIVEASASCVWKIYVCFRVSWVNTRLPSIWVNVSIWVIYNSLSSWVSFLSMNIRHSFRVSLKIIWRLEEFRVSVKEACICP
jgi:hypothetical protein